MKLEEAKITFLVNREYTEIEIHDAKANVTFVKVRLTPAQLSSMMSQLSRTDCECEVMDLDIVGKTHENTDFVFELPSKGLKENEVFSICRAALKARGMEEWEPDNYFRSQGSFFQKDGKQYARATIRRYI